MSLTEKLKGIRDVLTKEEIDKIIGLFDDNNELRKSMWKYKVIVERLKKEIEKAKNYKNIKTPHYTQGQVTADLIIEILEKKILENKK